jgi:hypothetical protein
MRSIYNQGFNAPYPSESALFQGFLVTSRQPAGAAAGTPVASGWRRGGLTAFGACWKVRRWRTGFTGF